MICICVFVILPLTLVGTVLGRNLAGTPDSPCRVNAVPRPIPEKKWFMEPLCIILLGGILPFGSIFIEMFVTKTPVPPTKKNKKNWHLTLQVLYFHIILGVQDLLRLRLHAVGVRNPSCGNCLRDYRLHLLPPECRRLSLALDVFLISCFDIRLCLYLFNLLFLLQNKVSQVFFKSNISA